MKLNLIGDNAEEKQLLDIATQGRTVQQIGNFGDKGVVLTLSRSEKAKEDQ